MLVPAEEALLFMLSDTRRPEAAALGVGISSLSTAAFTTDFSTPPEASATLLLVTRTVSSGILLLRGQTDLSANRSIPPPCLSDRVTLNPPSLMLDSKVWCIHSQTV